MKFTFDYEETLSRRIVIDAQYLSDAITELERKIDQEEIVLDSEDFAGAEVRMPVTENFLPQIQRYGEKLEGSESLDILIDFW